MRAIHPSRLDNWPGHYPWIDQEGYGYLRAQQEQMLDVLQFNLLLFPSEAIGQTGQCAGTSASGAG